MITFITGVPGSGKTLYTIDKLIRSIVGTTVKGEKDGKLHDYPRTIYTNINGLLVEHELIDGNGQWGYVEKDGRKQWIFDGVSGGLRDWHLWAKPGSLIVMDEVQKFWKPRPNGAPTPPEIEALETHRHMGVDFIFMTQHALLVDRNLLAFVGRHLHVRRIGNMALAVVYEWDHCSKSLLFKNSLTKSPYRYDKSVYQLYKSAELHTTQKRSLPGLIWFIALGLAGLMYLAPTSYARLQERTSGTKTEAKATPASNITKAPATTPPAGLLPGPGLPPPPPSLAFVQRPIYSGCIASATKCKCFDAQGLAATIPVSACLEALTQLGQSIPIFDSPIQRTHQPAITEPSDKLAGMGNAHESEAKLNPPRQALIAFAPSSTNKP